MIRRRRSSNEDGVSLVLVLIIVTVIALVTGAVVSQAASSLDTTVQLRDQAGAAYNADAGGQVAVNALRLSTFNNAVNSHCFTVSGSPSDSMTVPYTAAPSNGNSSGSAYVTCAAENGTGAQGSPVQITSANKPGQAIFAHSGLSFGDTGAETDYIRGSVSSGGTFTIKGSLQVTGTGSTVTAPAGQCPTSGSTPACTSPTAGVDPGYAAPATPAAAPPPTCPTVSGGPEILYPGVYNQTPDVYKTPSCGSNKIGWLYLTPGTYWFTFAGMWDITGTVVGGTYDLGKDGTGSGGTTTNPANVKASAVTVPNACVNPIKSNTSAGVELVFAGDTSKSTGNGVKFDKNSNAEFCATYQSSTPPTAFYATSTNTGTVISASNGDQPSFFFEGFVYGPASDMQLSVNNESQPFMNFGVIANTLHFGANPSIKCSGCPFINLPDNSPGFGTSSTIVDLSVYVCTGSGTCTQASGRLGLTARVLIYDATGSPVAGSRQMKILSWSQQR